MCTSRVTSPRLDSRPRTGASRPKAGRATSGRIINTSSESGLFGNAGQTNYDAAKAGIASMTLAMARELDRYGVTVNAIAPRGHVPG